MFDSGDDKLLQGRYSGSHGKTRLAFRQKRESVAHSSNWHSAVSDQPMQRPFTALLLPCVEADVDSKMTKFADTLYAWLFAFYLLYWIPSPQPVSPVAAFGFSGGIGHSVGRAM